MKILFLFLALAGGVTCQAGEAIVTTVVVHGWQTNSVGGRDWLHATNVVAIPNGQAARVAMVLADDGNVSVSKSGATWQARVGHVVQGPAEFTVIAYGDEPQVLTLERWAVKKAK